MLTDVTSGSFPSRRAEAAESVSRVVAGPSITAGVGVTLIFTCRGEYVYRLIERYSYIISYGHV